MVTGSRDIVEAGDRRYFVTPTRHEMALRPLLDPSSPLSKLCSLSSGDSAIRLLAFTKMQHEGQIDPIYRTRITLPIIIDPNADFLESLHDKPNQDKLVQLKTKNVDAEKQVKGFMNKMGLRYLKFLLEELTARRRRSISEQEFEEFAKHVATKREKEMAELAADMLPICEDLASGVITAKPFLDALEKHEDALNNRDILRSSGPLDDSNAGFQMALSKIVQQDIFSLSLRSTCLECYLRTGTEPYQQAQKNVRSPVLEMECRKCGGATVLHEIELRGNKTFSPVLDENKLAEIFVGYAMEKCDTVHKTFIHKNAQIVKDGNPRPSQQVDVLSVTRDGKIVVAEVTTSDRLGDVYEKANKKMKAFSDLCFDYMIYMSPMSSSRLEEYSRICPGVFVFGAKHISDLGFYVQRVLEKEAPFKPNEGNTATKQ
jgi:hypothetical protein